jgi:hypothetical protein
VATIASADMIVGVVERSAERRLHAERRIEVATREQDLGRFERLSPLDAQAIDVPGKQVRKEMSPA